MADSGPFDVVLCSQARLGIVAVLVGRAEATFPEVQALLSMTQGNLGAHVARLQASGYVVVEKSFVDRKPRTTLRLAPEGRRAFLAHVERLDAVARSAARPAARPKPR